MDAGREWVADYISGRVAGKLPRCQQHPVNTAFHSSCQLDLRGHSVIK